MSNTASHWLILWTRCALKKTLSWCPENPSSVLPRETDTYRQKHGKETRKEEERRVKKYIRGWKYLTVRSAERKTNDKSQNGNYVVLCCRLQPPNYRRLPWKGFASRGDLCLCQVYMKHAALDHRGPVCPSCCPSTWQPQQEKKERQGVRLFGNKAYLLLNSTSRHSFTRFHCAVTQPGSVSL